MDIYLVNQRVVYVNGGVAGETYQKSRNFPQKMGFCWRQYTGKVIWRAITSSCKETITINIESKKKKQIQGGSFTWNEVVRTQGIRRRCLASMEFQNSFLERAADLYRNI